MTGTLHVLQGGIRPGAGQVLLIKPVCIRSSRPPEPRRSGGGFA